jgi:predicted ATP-dependent Lon-type protease
VAFSITTYSILWKTPLQTALPVLGDMRTRSNIKPTRSLTGPLQVAVDNGRQRALLPIERKEQFLEWNREVLEKIDSIFFSDLHQATLKALR